ncbi:MAG: 2Fe-2S iron-sulfur cluster-binding protein [Pseudomonadota bacterium]
MPKVVFRSPQHEEHIVEIAGREGVPLIKIAKENGIPIEFGCEDGACGACLIKVTRMSPEGKIGSPLTKKEKTLLLEMGEITEPEIARHAAGALEYCHRLACQMRTGEAELLIEYDEAQDSDGAFF